jgi:tetratricopeptide (TPR) repeat protein
MFKYSFLFVFCIACWLLPGSTSAQAPPKPTDAKLAYSGEAFVVEQDSTRIVFENDGTSNRESTARVRIQSGAGVQRFGILTFSYQNSAEKVEIDYVRVHKPDDTVVPTPPENVQDMAAEITRQAPFYSDLREKHVAVKGLGVGDVLEYKVRWQTTKALAPGQFWFSANFSHEGINLQDQLQISVPRDLPVKWKSRESKPVIAEESGRRVFSWTTSNLEHKSKAQERKDQEQNTYQAARGKYPPPEIQLTSFQSWEEVGKWYDSLQRERTKPTAEIRAKAAELTKGLADDNAKIQAIYYYVSEQFRYIGIAFGIGLYQPHSASDVLSNQYGDCKDKHTLLAALLDAVGIKAFPALINSAHEIDPDVPSPSQFDHVISVISQDNRLAWADTTPEVARYGYLVGPLRDKEALVIPPDKSATLVKTPADPPSKAIQTFRIQAKLDDTGTLEGKVERSMQGDDNELLLRVAFRSVPMPQWKDLIQRISYASGFAGEVSDTTAGSPEKVDEPFRFAYHYMRKEYPDWPNRRISAPIPPITLPSLGDDDTKPSNPIWLGPPAEARFESHVELPKGYTPELSGNIDLVEDFAEYHASNEFKDGVLTTERRFIVKLREVTPEKYEAYKKFSKAVSDDHEQFIALMSGASTTASRMASYQELVRSLPYSDNPEASRTYDEAQSDFQRQDVEGGIASLERAVEIDPKFVRAWLLLGELYKFSLQTDKSLEAYRKAVAIDPRLNIVYKMQGYMLLGSKQFEEAVPIWEEYIKVAPNDGDGPANLATAFEGLERYGEAASALESAIKLNPHLASLYAGLGFAYLKAGNDDKALAAYRKALELDPQPVYYNNIGYALADARKKMDVALEYAQKAVTMEEDASGSVKLSDLQLKDLWHSTNLASYWDTLGWVYFQMADFDQAEKYLHSSWTLAQWGIVANHLGQVYEQQHKKAEAIKTYKLAAYCYSLGAAGASEEIDKIEERLSQLDPGTSNARPNRYVQSSEDLRQLKDIKLQRTAEDNAKAEFFVVLVPDPKTLAARVEDVKFIKGAEELKSADKWLKAANFKFTFPDNGHTRVLRRGTLGCYQYSGCTFTLMEPSEVKSVN